MVNITSSDIVETSVQQLADFDGAAHGIGEALVELVPYLSAGRSCGGWLRFISYAIGGGVRCLGLGVWFGNDASEEVALRVEGCGVRV